MFKKSPSRNQRSKGIRIKHVLQICLLLGICFWLIYQVKHSHDKRKEFDEKNAKVSMKAQSDDVIIKFGRKDLPRVQEESKNDKHEEEEDEENGVEEENKHDEEQEEKAKRLEEEEREGASKREEEEQEDVREDEGGKNDDEEQEAEIKDEEVEDEGRGDGDDEVDENEQERADGELDREEEFLDEEKEREAEGDDKENEERENEEQESQEESDNLANDQNHDGGRNAHDAREEHYKADDASSAVSQDTRMINSEADKLDIENSNDNSTMNVTGQENKANTTEETNSNENKSEFKVDEGKHTEGGSSLNVTYSNENGHENGSSNSISLSNTMNTTEETGNKPAEIDTGVPGSPQNGTASILKSTSAPNTTEDGMVTEEKYREQANETNSDNKPSDSFAVESSKIENVDSATTESSNSSRNAESGMSEDIPKINATAGGNSSESYMNKEIINSTQNEKSEGNNESGRTNESSESSSSNESVDNQHNHIESSDNTLLQEETDARVDLSTLPDITTEESNNQDTAAE
ncbi:hypothetical protein PTKIN_Ptkin10aG0183000 [Pterospermum kingtungense]